MNKEELKKEIIYLIDKELSYDHNGSGYSLLEDMTINYKEWKLPKLTKEEVDDALNELIAEGEVVMGNEVCGPNTLILCAYKPGIAIHILKERKDVIPPKLQEYYNKMYPFSKYRNEK